MAHEALTGPPDVHRFCELREGVAREVTLCFQKELPRPPVDAFLVAAFMAFDVMEVDQSVLAITDNNIPLSEVIYVDASFTMTHHKKGENLKSGRIIATFQETGV